VWEDACRERVFIWDDCKPPVLLDRGESVPILMLLSGLVVSLVMVETLTVRQTLA